MWHQSKEAPSQLHFAVCPGAVTCASYSKRKLAGRQAPESWWAAAGLGSLGSDPGVPITTQADSSLLSLPHFVLSCSAAHWLKPPTTKQHPPRPRPLTSAYWHNHRSQLLCLAAYGGLHVLLFALAASAHRALGISVMVAKGCGQCLNFNCSFIAVGIRGYSAGKRAGAPM